MKNKESLNSSYIVYGINNCINFLSYNTNCNIRSISLEKNGIAMKNSQINNKLSVYSDKIDLINNKDFSSKFNFKHSQGIVITFSGNLYADLYQDKDFDDNCCIIIADQIKDPQNLGQILRTSECAGVDGLVLPKHKSVQLTNTVLQVSQGAFMHLNIYSETNIVSSIKYLKSKGFWIVGVENSIDSKEWHKIDYKGKIAIVVGSEGEGIRRLVKESCDFLTTIKMHGKINSLNVSATVSAILFERQRQLSK